MTGISGARIDRVRRHVLACHDETSLAGSWIILDIGGNDLCVLFADATKLADSIVNLARWLVKEVAYMYIM